MITTIILAGGLGTRLREAVPDTPKVMAPVNGKPFLEHLLVLLGENGILFRDIVLALGYKSEQITQYLREKHYDCLYLEEKELLGTAGSVGNILRNYKKKFPNDYLYDDFMVLNGDTYLDIDYRQFIRKHMNSTAIASVATAKVHDTSRFCRLELDKKNIITKLAGKGLTGSGCVTSGAFIFSKTATNAFPEKGNLEDDVLKKFVDLKLCYAIPMKGKFIDIGVPEDYDRAKKDLQ